MPRPLMTPEEFTYYQERLFAILQMECYRETTMGELFEVTPELFRAMRCFLPPTTCELRDPRDGLHGNTVHVGHYLGRPVFLKLNGL